MFPYHNIHMFPYGYVIPPGMVVPGNPQQNGWMPPNGPPIFPQPGVFVPPPMMVSPQGDGPYFVNGILPQMPYPNNESPYNAYYPPYNTPNFMPTFPPYFERPPLPVPKPTARLVEMTEDNQDPKTSQNLLDLENSQTSQKSKKPQDPQNSQTSKKSQENKNSQDPKKSQENKKFQDPQKSQDPQNSQENKKSQDLQKSQENKKSQDPQKSQENKKTQDPQKSQENKKSQDPQNSQENKKSQDPQKSQENKKSQDPQKSQENKKSQDPQKSQENKKSQDPKKSQENKKSQMPRVAKVSPTPESRTHSPIPQLLDVSKEHTASAEENEPEDDGDDDPYTKAIKKLVKLFPNRKRIILELILIKCDNDVDKAIKEITHVESAADGESPSLLPYPPGTTHALNAHYAEARERVKDQIHYYTDYTTGFVGEIRPPGLPAYLDIFKYMMTLPPSLMSPMPEMPKIELPPPTLCDDEHCVICEEVRIQRNESDQN